MAAEKRGGCCGVITAIGGVILALALFGAIVQGIQKGWEAVQGPIPAPKAEKPSPPPKLSAMTPAQHIEEAKKALADKSERYPLGHFAIAKTHLSSIDWGDTPQDSPLRKEAQSLFGEAQNRLKISMRPGTEQLHRTSADRLGEAKNYLGKTGLEASDLVAAETCLLNITKEDAEYAEAQKLLKKIQPLIKKNEIARQRAAEKKDAEKRRLYPLLLERQFLDQGRDIYVKVGGKDATTLNIKWVLISRPIVHNLCKDRDLIRTWREMGFKKVVLTDGFRSSWEITP